MRQNLSYFRLLLWLFLGVSANFLGHTSAYQQENNIFPVAPQCGLSQSVTRILGGFKVKKDELPWMVFFSMGCGGTLINSNWILSAAHCFYERNPDSIVAFLNAHVCSIKHHRASCDSDAKAFKIKKVIIHENYDPGQLYNDIALIQIRDEVEYTNQTHPICLPFNNQAVVSDIVGKDVIVSGWGFNESNIMTEDLLKTHVEVWDINRCEAFKGIKPHILKSDLQICAGGVAHIDSCQGDSGGPLYTQLSFSNDFDDIKPFYQIGIVSFGPNPCGIKDEPGVYTNVSNYLQWIRETVLKNN